MPEIGTFGLMSGDGNGALPNGPSYRAHPRLYRLPWSDGAERGCSARGISDLDLFRDGKSVIDLDSEVSDGAFDLRVAEQELNGS